MSRSTKWLLGSFFAVVVTGIVLTGVYQKLLAGDQRVMVVSMEQDAGQPAREELKRDCGDLPGVSVVPDRGDASPQVQGRFPVRFRIAGATTQQEAALVRCLDEHQETVLGFFVED